LVLSAQLLSGYVPDHLRSTDLSERIHEFCPFSLNLGKGGPIRPPGTLFFYFVNQNLKTHESLLVCILLVRVGRLVLVSVSGPLNTSNLVVEVTDLPTCNIEV